MRILFSQKLLKTEISNNYFQRDKHKTFNEKYFKSGAEKPC